MQLDHITLRTQHLEVMRDFFLTVFDLEERPRPKPIQRIPGHWLYSGDEPIIHLIGSPSQPPGNHQATEAFDHVGFRLVGYDTFRAKLDRLNIRYSPMELPELKERRLFFFTPYGHLLEAVFRD
ncbi:MAG: VOC family protein [Sulfitobacter sp.]